jgi:hypothetical protein
VKTLAILLVALTACHHGATSTPATDPSKRGVATPPKAEPSPTTPNEPTDSTTGTLRLDGQVIDANDAPFAGATITLSPTARTTTSEADGSFAFDGLGSRSYKLSARTPDGHTGAATVTLTATSDPVIIRLTDSSAQRGLD